MCAQGGKGQTGGVNGGCIIFEEASRIPDDVVMEVGIPLYLVERMTMIFLSTHKGVDTIFYRLMQLEDEHGKKVFTSLNMTLKCDACIAEGVQGDHCPHRSHLVPPWKPQGRARIINRAMMKHFPQTFDEEISNIAQEGGKPAFSRADVDFLEMEQPYTDTRNDMPLLIVTCIDPTGGGRSRYAGASVYYRAPGEYVVRRVCVCIYVCMPPPYVVCVSRCA